MAAEFVRFPLTLSVGPGLGTLSTRKARPVRWSTAMAQRRPLWGDLSDALTSKMLRGRWCGA